MHDKFSPKRLDWQALCRGPLDILNIQDITMFSEIILCFSHYKSMGVIDPQGEASMDSRGLIGRIYVVENHMLLHTKLYGFREDF